MCSNHTMTECGKDHSMIETCCLKNVVFIQAILSFELSRKIKSKQIYYYIHVTHIHCVYDLFRHI